MPGELGQRTDVAALAPGVPVDALTREPAATRPSAGGELLSAIGTREALTRWSLLAADLIAFSAALAFAVQVVGPGHLRGWAVLTLPAVALVAKASGTYDRDELVLRRSTLDELPRLFALATLATLLLWLAEPFVLDGAFTRGQVVALWLGLVVLVTACRWCARRVSARRAPPERCLVLADAASHARLEAALTGVRGVRLVGSAPLDHVVQDLEGLTRRAEQVGAQRLIIAPPVVGQHEDVLNLIRGATATGLRVSLVPSLLEVVGSAVEFDDLGGTTVLGLKRFGLTRSSRSLKRSLDLVGAVAALLVFGPTMLVIAALVARDSPGGALFRQTRVGRDGRPFEILKFRTMVDGAHDLRAQLAHRNEAVGLFKIADDPRITRVGRVLRRTSLDELPQLFNVLRGEMSLVGPRPLVVDEDDRVTGFDRRRLVLTPGMTGPWQVAGSARLPLQEMVKIDYLYAAGWSLWTDVRIILRTVPYMLARRGR